LVTSLDVPRQNLNTGVRRQEFAATAMVNGAAVKKEPPLPAARR